MSQSQNPEIAAVEENGDIYLGACEQERRWQGAVQFDSLKAGLSLPMRVPRPLYEEALKAADPLAALEDLYRRVIRMHQKLVREELNRAAIPTLETMGRIAPNITEMVGGLEAIDGSRNGHGLNAGTVGISQMELQRLQGDIRQSINARQAQQAPQEPAQRPERAA